MSGVKLEPRWVPVPQSISEQAQATLQRMVDDQGMPLNAAYAVPAADDLEGWARMQAMVAQHYAAATAEAVESLTARADTVMIDGATVHIATPQTRMHDDAVIIDLHGGALVFGGGEACRVAALQQAERLGLVCYGLDYRMPPAHPYPAALDDCLALYRYLLQRYAPQRIIVAGRSAGGNLAVAMTLRARDEGLPLPGALVLLSPELDLTESGDSFQVNRLVDVVLPGSLMAQNLLYAAGADLSHPYLSPLFGDFSQGFPPTFLQSGTRDLFLSNAVRLHRQLQRHALPHELHLFEAMPHGGFMGADEDRELLDEIARFVRQRLAA